jgi:hypothetical protein
MLDEATRRTDLNAGGEFGMNGKQIWHHRALEQRINEYIERLIEGKENQNIKVNPDGTVSPVDPTQSSRFNTDAGLPGVAGEEKHGDSNTSGEANSNA